MVVILSEERSLSHFVRILLFKQYPQLLEGVDWSVVSFQGKQDLERNINRKLLAWIYGNPHFIITRDQDSGDCRVVKDKLVRIAEPCNRPFHVRIICAELESWILGDLEAVQMVYPHSDVVKFQNKKKYRYPDRLTNASTILEDLSGVAGKIVRAEAIAQVFEPERCRSKSFHVFWKLLTHLLTPPPP